MSRLIDVDIARRMLELLICAYKDIGDNRSKKIVIQCKNLIQNVPTFKCEEIVEPPKGYWIRAERRFLCQDTIDVCYTCSCCSRLNTRETNFCPDCGADMRREDEQK